LEIAFNAKYIMDFLIISGSKRDNQRVIWKFGQNGSQSELMFEGEEKLFFYILVPLKGYSV